MFIFHVCLYQEKFWLHCISLQEELLLWILSGSNYHVFFWLQNLSGLCAAIWNQFSEENQLRVESHWTESWVISEGRAWSADIYPDASFRFVDEGTPHWGDSNQDDGPQCLRMSFPPVEEWARVASKSRCRSQIQLFTDGMDTRGFDTCLQQVFLMGCDA